MEQDEILTDASESEVWQDVDAESIAELVARIEAKDIRLSFSAVKAFAPPYGSPRRFIYNKLKKPEQTAAMSFGALLDCLLTEGEDAFEEKFAVVPVDINRRTNEGKARWAAFCEKNSGKSLVTQKEVDLAVALSRRLWAARESRFVLEKVTDTQVRFGGKEAQPFEFFGWSFTGIADFVGRDPLEGQMVADLKVMAQASPRKARWTIKDLMYTEQLSLYKTALFGPANKQAAMYTVGIERTGEVFVCSYNQRDYDASLKRWEMIMQAFEKCVIMGDWHRSYGFWAEFESPRTRGIFNYSDF